MSEADECAGCSLGYGPRRPGTEKILRKRVPWSEMTDAEWAEEERRLLRRHALLNHARARKVPLGLSEAFMDDLDALAELVRTRPGRAVEQGEI